jgi:shikimate kinase
MMVFLLGYRGSGKTTIGRRLADRLWIKFVDTDDLIVQATGKPIAEIFSREGEERFRELEAEAVRQAAQLQDHVVALGGGAVLREENQAVLCAGDHKRIYLRCDPQILLERIEADPNTAANRPHLTGHGGGLEEIKAVLAQREPIYRKVMTSELDVTHLSPDKACAYIARML